MGEQNKISASRSLLQLISSFVFLIVISSLLFFIAGDWHWIEGWVFTAIYVAGSMAVVLYLYFADPGLLNERFRAGAQKGQSSFDHIIVMLIVAAYTAWYVIIPLDAKRYHWSPEFPLWIKIIGAVFTALMFYLFFLTFKENSFAAPVVKIQEERGQKVISTGVYSIVRHPLYAAGIFLFIGAPLLLGSLWGLIPGFALILILAVRSIAEEETLKQGLEGYDEYMQKVRWRFIPYIF
jgi:protein-S-isoprenylcysteine O-methyltransferase Ste14